MKRVYTIGPERRVYTIEASDPDKRKRRASMVVVYIFSSLIGIAIPLAGEYGALLKP